MSFLTAPGKTSGLSPRGPPSPVHVEDVGDVEASFVSRALDVPQPLPDVWLVKVPEFVRDAWMKAGAQGAEELGKLTLRKIEGKREPDLSITLPDATVAPLTAHEYNDLPKSYKLRLATRYDGGSFVRKENTYLWTEDANGAPYALAGKIVFEGTVTPDLNSRDAQAYENLLRLRTEKATKPVRTTKQADERMTIKAQWTGASRDVKKTVFGSNKLRDKRRALNDAARPRAERGTFLAALIALFRQRPTWTLAELQYHTGQNGAYTKEIMTEIGEPLIRGDLKGQWQLKGGYQDVAKADGEVDGAEEEDIIMDQVDQTRSSTPSSIKPVGVTSNVPSSATAQRGSPISQSRSQTGTQHIPPPPTRGASFSELKALDPAVLELIAAQLLGQQGGGGGGGPSSPPDDTDAIELSDDDDVGGVLSSSAGATRINLDDDDVVTGDEDMDDDGDGDGFEESEFGFL
ncbi:General transcription factor IIF subunit 2 [Gonapodya sp. JEL0774]|nr:General transcription factor IIF subunit 2 [Gonapodya sp. JEL0774]